MKLGDLVETQNETINSLYDEYDSIMEEIKSSSPNEENINRLNDAGIKLFNFMDRCYASLDAASEDENNEKQTQLDDLSGLFSDAFEGTIPNHYLIMRTFYGEEFHPSKHAFSGMQQLLVQIKSKDEIELLKAKCIEHNLPVKGFEKKRRFRMTKTYERVLSIILGIASLICFALLIIFMDEPTPLKYKLISILVSLLAGISAALLTGNLYLKVSEKLNAKSGFAVFVFSVLILNGLKFI